MHISIAVQWKRIMIAAKRLKGVADGQLFLLLFLTIRFVSADPIVSTFSEPYKTGGLQHLVVDSKSGLLYVGGLNRLYQLSANLNLAVAVETGPKQSVNKINKALVIDDDNSRLIACGSYRGFYY